MIDQMNKTEHVEDQITLRPDSIPDKLTVEEHGKEETDSGEELRQRQVLIPFRQPIYSSDTGPQFPQELIERICEFLWDEPVQLAVRCTRICPAWYHAARRVLSGDMITCRTQKALQDYAHTLTSRRNAPYRKRFGKLCIYDNARKPFAHVWPMFIPGWILPELNSVTLGDLDWSTKTPHDVFFAYMSSYTSISRLDLRDCRFRSLPDLRRVINALPNLTSLRLHNVTLQHPLRPGSVPDYSALRARSHKLESIELFGSTPGHPDVSSDYQGPLALDYQTLLHMVVANSSAVTHLALDLRFFASLSALRQFLAHFCYLTSFAAWNHFASSPMITFEETIHARTENTSIHSWSSFVLRGVPDQSALQLLQLLITPESCSKLENFRIYIIGRPSAALLSCTSHVVHAAGHRLNCLTWDCTVDPDLKITPSLGGNTSLQTLEVFLRDLAPSPQKIHSALTAMLSDIVSMDLQHMRVHFGLAHLEVLSQNHERTPAVLDPASESISAFHTILSRKTFGGLPLDTRAAKWPYLVLLRSKCVEFTFDVRRVQDNPTAVATIKAYIITLFTPWLDRGIVVLAFDSANGYECITCVPASMLSEDTSSDSKVEDVEENEPVGTEQ
ncbi:hypothetical protein EVJ58_g8853 [Rhodofomes roseus]|uniref:F-box domain-containing protein n=1 Tax=Rhodofomes roseus TaxID=34475 RepID=A0A4Y9XZ84_9APHY|nr:hypothetical protein EVJ58_g8853 [Rhodofomes roseus]